jgi:hypothetical protein
VALDEQSFYAVVGTENSLSHFNKTFNALGIDFTAADTLFQRDPQVKVKKGANSQAEVQQYSIMQRPRTFIDVFGVGSRVSQYYILDVIA